MACAVVPHPDIVDDALGLFLAAPELILLTATQVNLVVGELTTGERLAVRRRRLQVGSLACATPQAVAGTGRDLLAERVRVERGVEQELQIVQVVLPVVAIA